MSDPEQERSILRRLHLVGALAIVAVALGLWAASVAAYVSSGYNWGVKQVPFYVNPSNLYVSQAHAITAIQVGASVWTQSNASVQLSYAGTTNGSSAALNYKNEVFFRTDAPGPIAQTYWWASNGHLVDADIVFYENNGFVTHAEPCSGAYYIENTVAHEFGHALGLYHSSIATATMFPTEGACETSKETLDPDDIAGILSLYPASTNVPPTAPSQLTVGPAATNPTGSLALSWIDTATNASGFRVERSPDGYTFAQIAQLGSSATSYVDSGLAPSTARYYRVNAFNGAGTSDYSNFAMGQTQALTSAPGVPAATSPANGATRVGTNVTLSWSCSGAQSYDVYISGALYASNLTGSSVAVSSLAAGRTYSWLVVAKNTAGSTSGPTWSFTTKVAPGKKK